MAAAKKAGATVKEFYWTLGRYDMVSIMEAPDVETVTALGLSVGKLGNVRTETLCAFDKAGMEAILKKVGAELASGIKPRDRPIQCRDDNADDRVTMESD